MKKRVMSVLIAVTMLAGMGTMASAANSVPNFPNVSPAISVDEESGLVYMECAQDFLDYYDAQNIYDMSKANFGEAFIAEMNNQGIHEDELYEAIYNEFGIDVATVDEAIDVVWDEFGFAVFCLESSEDLGAEITVDNYFSEDTQRLIYIFFINRFQDEEGNTPYAIGVDSSMEEVIEYIYVDMFGEAVPGESTTEATTEEVTEPTTADGEEETTTEEVTEPTTANGEEETTAEDTTASTTAKDNSQNPSTGDPSMLLYGALAAVGGLGALATKKRK